YYLTALLNLLGPVKRIAGLAGIAIPQRTTKSGKSLTVHTPDHICGTMEFENGAIGSIITSFATRFAPYGGRHPITVFGTDGTMKVPDPNEFDGPVLIRGNDDEDFREARPQFARGHGRSIGLADMALAIRENRPHRASAEQAFAVLDLMQGFLDSSESARVVAPQSRYVRPPPMEPA
ncbi:MAG: Gfo/Idh/MocA family oxidoreductase, partial [Tepidisphaeraceae bacterium]